jgi:hypothetical protein
MKQIKPYIIEKLKININNRIKEHTEIGDLFNVNIEPHLFSWEAKNFFNKTDWTKLETYLETHLSRNCAFHTECIAASPRHTQSMPSSRWLASVRNPSISPDIL